MDRLDPRIVRVGVEVDGQIQVYEDLDISVRGVKTANPLQNTCTVIISNLTRETRNYLLTETSPFNANRTPKRLIVEAGRVSTGVARLFVGEITEASPSQPPDIALSLKAKTSNFAKGMILSRSGAEQQSLSSLAAQVAGDLSLTLDFQATDKQVANYTFSGPALKQTNALELIGGVDVFVDDDTMIVKDTGRPLPNRSRILSQESGLIGAPEATERGVKVRFFLDKDTVLGGALVLESKLNPSLNGEYTIFQLEFEAETRGPAFYWVADCSRNGYTPSAQTDATP